MQNPLTPLSVVVGIDFSKAAVQAALWAVDEAVSRDVPLHLVYAIDEHDSADPETAAREFAAAEVAVRDAVIAVQATDKPIKVEAQIVQAPPAPTLVELSRSAAMVCVGAIGLHHVQPHGVGSTAEILATTARCPVAVIRGHYSPARHDRWIVVHADELPDDGVVLERAMEEARLRGAPLRVVSCPRSVAGGHDDQRSTADGSRQISAQLRRRLQKWSRQYPDVDVELVAAHNSILGYLVENDHDTQLVVVSARNRHDMKQLLGHTGNAALQHTDCSMLVVDHHRG